ncbi:NAD(P)-binding domain-containing protein [Sorangium sp. So ce136]|uniref:NAD(P)-dependent oxidoreductase n=1 Tax=Sorangium sp. So ce136 TaxID=3133284 RepID=UPI003EFD2C24
MSEVAVIGLGPMGFALARVLLERGDRVTVWNRTAAKAEPLVAQGAALAASVAEAVQASAVVVVCVADYNATYRLLEARDVAAALAGKVLVQLSTGTPEDARRGEAWAKERGVDYLDGAILAIPNQIGKPESTILVSGSDAAYRKSKALLERMAGTVPYFGEKVGTASALDLAFLSYAFLGLIGFYHGARICEVEGLSVADLGSMLADVAPAIGAMIKHDAHVIQAGTFGDPQSSVDACWRGLEILVRQAKEAGINADLPSFAAGLFRKGVTAGYGAESPGALMKVLRENA